MPRLFVAIDFPADIKAELIALQPAAVQGLRFTKLDQLHLTLHFLGDCELPPVVDSLQFVRTDSFPMLLEGVGQFRQRDGGAILWAGVKVTAELRQLHSALAAALAEIGYQLESRPYSPHITLARGRPESPRSMIEKFLDDHAGWRTREFPVTDFRLMSSELTDGGPIYQCEQVFPLDHFPHFSDRPGS